MSAYEIIATARAKLDSGDHSFCSIEGKRLSIEVPSGSPIFLQDIPQREQSSGAERPFTNPCLPHSQLTENPSKEVWDELIRRVFEGGKCTSFPGVEGPNKSFVSLPCTQALHFKESKPNQRNFVKTEFAHVHGQDDGSLHLILSEADTKTVIDRGWGERHLLAGKPISLGKLPEGLLMVYAPRSMAEIEVIMTILQSSYQFARGDFIPLGFSP